MIGGADWVGPWAPVVEKAAEAALGLEIDADNIETLLDSVSPGSKMLGD